MKLMHIPPILALFLLANCGGGGTTSTSPSTIAQGVYQGTSNSGVTQTAFVLDDGTVWGLYGTISQGVFTVGGLNVGHPTATGGSFKMPYTNFAVPGTMPVAGYGLGSYTTSSFSASLTDNGVTQYFNFTQFPSTIYNYNTPAFVSSIAGNWSGKFLSGESSSIDILPNGTFSGTSSVGCAYTGVVSPRPSGVNIFDVTFKFGSAPCILAHQSSSGFAVTFSSGNGSSTLFVSAVTPNLTSGISFYAVR